MKDISSNVHLVGCICFVLFCNMIEKLNRGSLLHYWLLIKKKE